jgi:hypothetical protein
MPEPAPDPDDELFPSGEWTGFYVQYGVQWRQDLVLTFADGGVRGSGGDALGPFAIRGRYDRAALEVTWQKSYLGAHTVDYRGFREGKGIWGTWELAPLRGGFKIWPRRAGEEVEADAASEREAAPAAPVPASPSPAAPLPRATSLP